jgi:hypothetical protein
MAIKPIKSVTYGGSDKSALGTESDIAFSPGIGKRIAEIAKCVGSRVKAAEIAEVSQASFQRYISEQSMPPFDAVAKLCLKSGVSLEWLATGDGEMRVQDKIEAGASHPVNAPNLIRAVEFTAEVLGDGTLSQDKYAQLVVLIYEALQSGLPEAQVLAFARPAARGLTFD